MQVHPDDGRLVGGPFGQDRLDDEEPAPRAHGGAAGGQHPAGVVVGPVVEHPRQHVGVGPGRDLGEEVAGGQPATVGHALGDQAAPALLDHGRLVDQDGVQVRGRPEDGPEQDPVAAAGVDQPADPAEVVGGDHVPGLLFGPGGHRGLERRLLLVMAAQVVEEPVPVDVLEGRAAVADGGHGPGRRLVVDPTPGQHRPPHRSGRVRPEALAELGEGEPAALLLGQDLLEHQPPQGPVSRSGSAPTAEASSAPVRGPSASRSATPSRAATYSSWVVTNPSASRPIRTRTRTAGSGPETWPCGPAGCSVPPGPGVGSGVVSCGWRRGRRPGRPARPRRPGPRWPGRGTRPGSGRPGRRGPAGC